jgi:Zn-dependent M28 family amino/carboxypeptidase
MGTLLALAEHLNGQPLQSTEVWLAFTGCEESGGDGMFTLIKESGAQLRDAVFIDFEMVGIGDRISYIREEGNLIRFTISQEIESLVKDVGQRYGLQPASTPLIGASTECSILLKHGFKAVCLIAHRQGSTILPEWHRLTDTPDRLQVDSLERVQALTWDLLQRFDQG